MDATTCTSRESLLMAQQLMSFTEKMEEILSCRICLELKRCPMYQCRYGHLICAGCFNNMLAESRLQNEIASCPFCQTLITKDLCFRNIAVEKTISELPITCPYCSLFFPAENFTYHEAVDCEYRPSVCSNSIIGCPWQGTNASRPRHERECKQPSLNGYEILKSLEAFDERQKEGHDLYNKIMELLSVEKISYTDLQLKHSETISDTALFESSKFSAFENQWLIRVSSLNATGKHSAFTYQLVIKTKLISPLNLQFIILRGPYNDMEIKPQIYQFKFTDKASESSSHLLDIPRSSDVKNFHSAKRINLRILMFVVK